MSIAAVIVTFNSEKHIVALLNKLCLQNQKIDEIIVVDNNSHDMTCQLVTELNYDHITLIRLDNNQGGAGGFYHGLKHALKNNHDYIFTLDDDAMPKSNSFIKNMINFKNQHQINVLSPLIVDINNHKQTAYEYKINHKKFSDVDCIQKNTDMIADIKLFNGTLFDKQVIEDIGLPRPEFFIRGDEQEYRERILQSRYNFLTSTQEIVYHPASIDEYHYIHGKRYHHIDNRFKQFYSTRNRFYLLKLKPIATSKKIKMVISEWYRYTHFYLYYRKDIVGYYFWLKAMVFGLIGYMNNHLTFNK